MRFCTSCGHQLGGGRFCTNCGAPAVVSPTVPDDITLVRSEPLVPPSGPTVPAPPPVQPPAAAPMPPAARYPLYADTVATPAAAPPTPAVVPAPQGNTGPGAAAPGGPAPRRRSSSGMVWLVALAVLVLIVATGALLLIRGSGDDAGADPSDTSAQDDRGGQRRGGGDPGGDRGDLAAQAEVQVPAVAPASSDNDGNPVTFVGGNMLDGDPRTCWRMAGDGTGSVLSFRFDEPVEITSVGLVNGYAKTDPPDDWYAANRRILAVAWVFDDGTEVTQDLYEQRSVQTLEIDPVETTVVELRILEVSAPGRGPSGRDYTAISDVAFGGS